MYKFKERYNSYSKKWDGMEKQFGRSDLLPLWLADMDFKVSDKIVDVLYEYISYGIPGYFKIPESYWTAFIEWEKKHDLMIDRQWLRFSPSLIASISWLINILTKPGQSILVLTPVYKQFVSAVINNERKIVKLPLDNDNGYYSINYDLLEKSIEENDIKLLIFCSPHNPTGRVWTNNELKMLSDICIKHSVYIISDEIYQDIVFDTKFTPTLVAANNMDSIITLTSAAKSFNIAGLRNSFVIIPNDKIRREFDVFRKRIRIKKGNSLGYIASEAAYTYGEEWLNDVRSIIFDNYLFLNKQLLNTKLIISPLQGTFLSWIDFRYYHQIISLSDFMINKCRSAVEFGHDYGGEEYRYCIRVNLATDKRIISDFATRLCDELNKLSDS